MSGYVRAPPSSLLSLLPADGSNHLSCSRFTINWRQTAAVAHLSRLFHAVSVKFCPAASSSSSTGRLGFHQRVPVIFKFRDNFRSHEYEPVLNTDAITLFGKVKIASTTLLTNVKARDGERMEYAVNFDNHLYCLFWFAPFLICLCADRFVLLGYCCKHHLYRFAFKLVNHLVAVVSSAGINPDLYSLGSDRFVFLLSMPAPLPVLCCQMIWPFRIRLIRQAAMRYYYRAIQAANSRFSPENETIPGRARMLRSRSETPGRGVGSSSYRFRQDDTGTTS